MDTGTSSQRQNQIGIGTALASMTGPPIARFVIHSWLHGGTLQVAALDTVTLMLIFTSLAASVVIAGILLVTGVKRLVAMTTAE